MVQCSGFPVSLVSAVPSLKFLSKASQAEVWRCRFFIFWVDQLDIESCLVWLLVTIGVCAPLHRDGFVDQLGGVKLRVAKLFGYVLADVMAHQVGHEVGDNLAIGGRLQVTVLLGLHQG